MHRAAWPQNSFDQIWEKRFECLQRFVKQNNRFPVTEEVYEGFQLGNWLKGNRVQYYANKLDPIRRQKLESYKNIFHVHRGYQDKIWMHRLKLLKKFRKMYRRWPQGRDMVEGFAIGSWLYRNYVQYIEKKLPANRLRLLLDAGYVFKPLRKVDGKWEEYYDALWVYIEKYPERWNEKNPLLPGNRRLRVWCNEMIKRHRMGSLKPEHRKKLEAVNFPFTQKISHHERFMTQAKYYLLFKRFYPGKKVDSYTVYPRGNRLGRWCIYVRSRGRKAFSKDQLKLLEKVGFNWGDSEDPWRKKFDSVVQFYRQYSRIPQGRKGASPGELKLARWLRNQKQNIKSKKLTYDKYELLKPYINGVVYTGYSKSPSGSALMNTCSEAPNRLIVPNSDTPPSRSSMTENRASSAATS